MSKQLAQLIMRFLELQTKGVETKLAAIQACEELECWGMEAFVVLLTRSDLKIAFIEWAQKHSELF